MDRQYQVIAVTRTELNVEHKQDMLPFLSGIGRVDYVINCTAVTNVDQCEDEQEKAFAVNSIAVLPLARYCQQYGSVLLHISTDYVFNGWKKQPYVEDDCPQPLNVYGTSKLAGEQFIQAYLPQQHFIFRVSSLFGKAGMSGKGRNFVETMLKLQQQRSSLTIIDHQIMSPTYTLDVARVIHFFIDKKIEDYGIYHCSGEGHCSWFEFATRIFQWLQIEADIVPVSHANYPLKAQRPVYSVLDNTKINAYMHMPHWQDSLKHYLSSK